MTNYSVTPLTNSPPTLQNTVTITVPCTAPSNATDDSYYTNVNQPNDVDPNGLSLSITSTTSPPKGAITPTGNQITPNANVNGTDTFT